MNGSPRPLFYFLPYEREREVHKEVLGIYTSPFLDTDELKMAFQAQKVSRTLEKQAPELKPGPVT